MKPSIRQIGLIGLICLISFSAHAGMTNIVVSVGDTAINAIPSKAWNWLFVYFSDSPFHLSVTGAATTSSPKWPAGSSMNYGAADQFTGPISFVRSGSSNMTVHAIGHFSP